MRRFYSPQPLKVGHLTLGADESHHLLRVLRVQPGEPVVVFDGQGTEAVAGLEAIERGCAVLAISEVHTAAKDDPRPIILAVAVPKGDRFAWLVEKAVELGVSRLVPLRTQRSVVDPGANKLERLRQTIVPACKQCGRNRLMALDDPCDWPAFLAGVVPTASLLVADPSGEPWKPPLRPESPLILCVGPEGGFTADELSLSAGHHAHLVSLGPRILRIETAALALAVLAAQGT